MDNIINTQKNKFIFNDFNKPNLSPSLENNKEPKRAVI